LQIKLILEKGTVYYRKFFPIVYSFRKRIHFTVEDSIFICQLFRQHGGNASVIIQKLHAKHRLTQLRTDWQSINQK